MHVLKSATKRAVAMLLALVMCFSLMMPETAFAASNPSSLTVEYSMTSSTSYGGYTTGRYSITVDGYTANAVNGYCVDPMRGSPADGTYTAYELTYDNLSYINANVSGTTADFTESTDTIDRLRFFLYYGYNGPGWDEVQEYYDLCMDFLYDYGGYSPSYTAVTHILLSMAKHPSSYVTTANAGNVSTSYLTALGFAISGTSTSSSNATYLAAKYATYPGYTLYEKLEELREAGELTVPDEFLVYVIPASTQSGTPTQAILFWLFEDTPNDGELVIEKYTHSSYTLVVADNDDYSLEGAVYGIYTSKSCSSSSLVTTVTTLATGKTEAVELEEGTYYVQEITPPPGYELDETVYTVTITAENQTTLTVTETPTTVAIELSKYSTDESTTSGNGNYSLKGAKYAVFTSKTDAANATKSNYTSLSSYVGVMTTNAAGEASLSELAYGTYYVKEVVAPQGYELDDTVYTCDCTKSSGTITYKLSVGDKPDSVTINLTKKSANSDLTDGNGCYSLTGATYAVYTSNSDAAKADEDNYTSLSSYVGSFTTGSSSTETLTGLPLNTYYVKEVISAPGYLLDETVYTCDCTDTSKLTNGTYYLEVEDEPATDPLGITITKQSDQDVDNPLSMAGAVFVVKYYDTTDASSVDDLPAQATKTWYITTKYDSATNTYKALLNDSYLVSGSDDLYTDDGEVLLPIGTYTIEEVTAPDGYTTDGGWMYLKQSGSTTSVSTSGGVVFLQVLGDSSTSGASLTVANSLTNDLIKTETSIRGGVEIYKYDAETGTTTPQGDATMEGAERKREA